MNFSLKRILITKCANSELYASKNKIFHCIVLIKVSVGKKAIKCNES